MIISFILELVILNGYKLYTKDIKSNSINLDTYKNVI